MKQLHSILALLLLMICSMNFTACSDDDEAPGNTSDLIGLWEEIYNKGWEKENGKIDYEYEYEYEEGEGGRIEFKSDGTYIEYDAYDGDWEVDMIGTWEYQGNKIYVTYYDEDDEKEYTQHIVVKELTSSRLVVEASEQETYNGTLYEVYAYSINRKIK